MNHAGNTVRMASKEAETDATGEKAGPSALVRSANTAGQETYIVTGNTYIDITIQTDRICFCCLSLTMARAFPV